MKSGMISERIRDLWLWGEVLSTIDKFDSIKIVTLGFGILFLVVSNASVKFFFD